MYVLICYGLFMSAFYQGFRKADLDRWEFANEKFIKDQKHLLKDIQRKKPIHSHSHPPGFAVDPQRAALEQEIQKLFRKKNALQSKLLSYNYLETEKLQLEDFQRRLDGMEKRQTNLQNFFEKALQDSFIVELLSRKIESMNLAAYNKKRRLSQVDHMQPVAEGSLVDNPSYFRLELTHGSNEDEESLQKYLSEGELTGTQTRTDLANTGAINLADPKEASGNVQVEAAAQHGVNDVFWEQFLTERPCYSDNEEAISN